MKNIGYLNGKRLLILGATAGEVTLVKRAQELGIYVIVTDYNTDLSLSPAKRVADEAWDISWSDIDALELKCHERNVHGVTAGYSEFRVENMIKLCERLNLPSYSTTEQLDITRDKIKFKNVCRECGVPVVKEFSSPEEVDEYPVIVKPVDRAGSIGISVATDKHELEKACEYAYEKSVCKQIIIEKFIEKGTKIDFYYAVEDGEITLISSCDTINAKNNGYERVVQSAWLYPQRDYSLISKKIDPVLQNMIRHMGIKYGCIFFSGFIDKDNEVVFFECGFRLEGGHQYNYVNQKGPYNYLDLFIIYALTGNTEIIERKPVDENLYAITVNLYASKGVISDIRGVDEISQMSDCCLALIHGRIGEECRDDKAILNKIAMFQFASHSPLQLQQDVERMYELFKAYDESGNDMVYDRIDTSLIESWWNNSEIEIKLKDSSISFEQLQHLLNLAHEQNREHGLVYATANQTVEKLISKIGSGKCFVAVAQGFSEPVGTCTVEERILNYWYVGEKDQRVLLMKLLGVHPCCKGMGVGQKLVQACLKYAEDNNYKMIVADSAEENAAFRKLIMRNGFRIVDCCKYVANNFISTVYVKWLDEECPWTEDYCMEKYNERRNIIISTNQEKA